MRSYVAEILDLLERPALAANEAGNDLTPRALERSTAAKAAWVAFHNRIETEMASDGAFEGLRDVASKAAENAARIAAVLTIVEKPDASAIEAEAMAAGCELMTWYLAEALRLSGAHRQSPSMRNAIKSLEWLHTKRRATITLREVMQFGPSAVRCKAEAEAALGKLEDHGWSDKLGEGRGVKWSIVPKAGQ
jgi:hypothetical protein